MDRTEDIDKIERDCIRRIKDVRIKVKELFEVEQASFFDIPVVVHYERKPLSKSLSHINLVKQKVHVRRKNPSIPKAIYNENYDNCSNINSTRPVGPNEVPHIANFCQQLHLYKVIRRN